MKSVACSVSQRCFLLYLMDFALIDRRDDRSIEGDVGKTKAKRATTPPVSFTKRVLLVVFAMVQITLAAGLIVG